MPTFQILCLANSYKYQGRCIAGLRRDGLGWIRPVSSHIHGTLFLENYQLDNQQEPQLLDIIEIDFIRPLPEVHQPENWLISDKPWRFISRFDINDINQKQQIKNFLDSVAVDKSYIFSNFEKKISYSYLLNHPVRSSLVLVKPAKLIFKIITDDERKIKASFSLQDSQYYLSVTDPNFLEKIKHIPSGSYPASELVLPDFNPENIFFTISLGEPFENYCHKLVAAVISF